MNGSMVNSENELREAGRKRPALNLTLAQKALITTCPQLARVLPCKWPLRNIAGLAKLAANVAAGADAMSRAFHETIAPPKFYAKHDSLSAAELALVKTAVKDGLSLANVRRVMKSMVRWNDKQQKYEVLPPFTPLVRMKAGRELCAMARRAMSHGKAGASKRKSKGLGLGGDSGTIKFQRSIVDMAGSSGAR